MWSIKWLFFLLSNWSFKFIFFQIFLRYIFSNCSFILHYIFITNLFNKFHWIKPCDVLILRKLTISIISNININDSNFNARYVLQCSIQYTDYISSITFAVVFWRTRIPCCKSSTQFHAVGNFGHWFVIRRFRLKNQFYTVKQSQPSIRDRTAKICYSVVL